jgi:hypothetical protein
MPRHPEKMRRLAPADHHVRHDRVENRAIRRGQAHRGQYLQMQPCRQGPQKAWIYPIQENRTSARFLMDISIQLQAWILAVVHGTRNHQAHFLA